MLKDSEYYGLIVVRLKATKLLDVVGDIPDDDDPEPLPDTTPDMEYDSAETIEWVESWDKFFISKHDDWLHFARIIQEFCQDVCSAMLHAAL